jgi:hypothetical protein
MRQGRLSGKIVEDIFMMAVAKGGMLDKVRRRTGSRDVGRRTERGRRSRT